MSNSRILRSTPLLPALALVRVLTACGGAEPMSPPAVDAGIVAPTSVDAGTAPGGGEADAGVVTDAGQSTDPETCPEGYVGDRCDRCAPGYQDGNADGVCSLACDAVGDIAPQCGHGRCFIDTTIDGRACACEEGYVGAHCDQCDDGYMDIDGSGTCARVCQLDCGSFGTCEIGRDDAESCVCDEGYEGAICDLCATGFVPDAAGGCSLDLPRTAGLGLWLDATEAGSLAVQRNGDITRWRDRRNARGVISMVPNDTDAEPELVDAAIAGRPAVRFDGVDDRLGAAGFTGFGGDDYTFFVIVQPHSRASAGVLSAAHAELGVALGLDLYSPGTRFVHQLPGMPNSIDEVSSEDFAPTEPMVIGIRRWTSGLFDFIRMYGRFEGDPMGIEVDDNIISVGNLGALNIALGVGPSGDFLAGDVGEVLVYERALEEDEMLRVLDYLAAKWAVR